MFSKKPYQYNFHFHSSEVTYSNLMFDLITSISKERTIIIIIIIIIIIKIVNEGIIIRLIQVECDDDDEDDDEDDEDDDDDGCKQIYERSNECIV